MKKLLTALLISLAASCNRDYKRETITNYIRVIWRVRSDDEFSLTKIEETRSIIGKDSIEILIKEYVKGTDPLPPLDTVLVNIDKDIAYNSSLLNKTSRKIDSLRAADNSFFSDYIKSFVELKTFTSAQLDELRFQKYLLTRYHQGELEIFGRQVLCEYEIRGHTPGMTSKKMTHTFFLSPDSRKIYAVK